VNEGLRLTRISTFPGKNRSGMRKAYRRAPVIYSTPENIVEIAVIINIVFKKR
jgi:hypothetical protein